MKKIILITTAAVVLATLFTFNSCNKEGIYKPKEKISAIYEGYSAKIYMDGEQTQEVSVNKTLSERWTWDKKKLSQIEGTDETVKFTYKNNQLIKASTWDTEAEYFYKKSLLDKIEIKDKGQLVVSVSIDERNDKKITRLTYQISYDGFDFLSDKNLKNTEIALNNDLSPILKMVLPVNFMKIMQKNAGKKQYKANFVTFTVEMSYSGNNMIEQKLIYEDNSTETYIFTYDSKKNPYYKSFHMFLMDGNSFSQSENNILTMYDKDYPEDIITYSYEYDGDYPKKSTYNSVMYFDEGMYVEYLYNYYYEYE